MDYVKLAKEFRKQHEANLSATRSILEKNLTPEELLSHIDIYNDWENLAEGYMIKPLEYLKYKNLLYQCREGKGHAKQNTWAPNVAHSQFKVVSPKGVIPEWVTGKGYDKGETVTHNGYIWISKNPGNIAEPSTDGGHFRFWEQGEKVL